MTLIIDILLLFVAEILAISLARALDYYGKQRNYDKVIRKKINILFVKSKYEERNNVTVIGRPISKLSLVFQIINWLYIIFYLVIAIIDTFVVFSDILCDIQYYSLLAYGGIVIALAGIVSFFLPSHKS